LHATLATGTDHAELLDPAVYLHVHVTRPWLVHAGAPTDLVRRTAFLARRLAQGRDEATTLAVAEFAVRKQAKEIIAALDSAEMDYSGSAEAWRFGGGRDLARVIEDAPEPRGA
jgi:hypothetical protein